MNINSEGEQDLIKVDFIHRFLDCVHEGIVILDAVGKVEHVNLAFIDLVGSSQETLHGVEGFSLFGWPSDLNNMALAKAAPYTICTGKLKCKNGENVQVHCVLLPCTTHEVLCKLYVIVSVFDGRIMDAPSKDASLSLIGQIAAGIAHEIRNPLTALKGFNQLMTGQASTQHAQFHLIMAQELNRIETILSSLLTLTKPHETSFSRHSLPGIVGEVVALMEGHAYMKGILLNYSWNEDAEDLFCACVAAEVKQVFVNCLKNGIEAMPDGGQLTISVDEAQPFVCVRFRDEGVGMSPEALARLGQPFYTNKELGTGLGLMMSRQLVERHGGWMSFSSQVGQGTIVSVYLPLEDHDNT